jgi:hypothetical protein
LVFGGAAASIGQVILMIQTPLAPAHRDKDCCVCTATRQCGGQTSPAHFPGPGACDRATSFVRRIDDAYHDIHVSTVALSQNSIGIHQTHMCLTRWQACGTTSSHANRGRNVEVKLPWLSAELLRALIDARWGLCDIAGDILSRMVFPQQ